MGGGCDACLSAMTSPNMTSLWWKPVKCDEVVGRCDVIKEG